MHFSPTWRPRVPSPTHNIKPRIPSSSDLEGPTLEKQCAENGENAGSQHFLSPLPTFIKFSFFYLPAMFSKFSRTNLIIIVCDSFNPEAKKIILKQRVNPFPNDKF